MDRVCKLISPYIGSISGNSEIINYQTYSHLTRLFLEEIPDANHIAKEIHIWNDDDKISTLKLIIVSVDEWNKFATWGKKYAVELYVRKKELKWAGDTKVWYPLEVAYYISEKNPLIFEMKLAYL